MMGTGLFRQVQSISTEHKTLKVVVMYENTCIL